MTHFATLEISNQFAISLIRHHLAQLWYHLLNQHQSFASHIAVFSMCRDVDDIPIGIFYEIKCTNDDNDYKTIETLKIVADTICE